MNRSSPSAGRTLHVLQFTDSHLLVHEDGLLKGTATWQTFRAVMERLMQTKPRPDFVLATGDLVHDGPRAVYRRLRERLDGLGAPVYVLPGNHDDPVLLADVFRGWIRKTDQGAWNSGGVGEKESGGLVDFGWAVHGNWLIVPLNDVVPGRQHGLLDDKELARMEALLRRHPGHHVLLCLHHHPVPFGRAGMDSIGLRNAERFFSVVDGYPTVRGIVWGHIHNAFEARRGEVLLLGTPSTCFQFDANSEQISPTEGPPGYRRLMLDPDGRIRSHVVWL